MGAFGQGGVKPLARVASGIVTTGSGPAQRGRSRHREASEQGDLPAPEEQQASSEEISPVSGVEQETTTSQSIPESGSHSRGPSRGQAVSGPASVAGAAASGSTSGIQGADGSGSRGRKRRPSVPPTEEVVERRKQKRLAKNRVTAAASRERKRNQLTSLEQRVQSLERQNSELTTKLAARNEELGQVRGELASLNRGASGEGQAVRASESAALEDPALPLAHTLQPRPPPSTQTCTTPFLAAISLWNFTMGLLHMVLLVAVLASAWLLAVPACLSLPALISCGLEIRPWNHRPTTLIPARNTPTHSRPRKELAWEHTSMHKKITYGCRV